MNAGEIPATFVRFSFVCLRNPSSDSNPSLKHTKTSCTPTLSFSIATAAAAAAPPLAAVCWTSSKKNQSVLALETSSSTYPTTQDYPARPLSRQPYYLSIPAAGPAACCLE
ncbi:hypothetical protein Salat_0219700 [Sesamum alatum]|uniref:Uncharacterized protein n=1 Tax=Sesamum alatum TaxID=300844 RepID=A0AAE1YYZ2_9LAMI|nr:hypothetical protein Salat_0219700 [Sesamum alatum]